MIGFRTEAQLPLTCLFNLSPELFVKSDFLYFPLLFDEDLEKEINRDFISQSSSNEIFPSEDLVVESEGKIFIRGITIKSFLSCYKYFAPDSYEQQRSAVLDRYSFLKEVKNTPVTERLHTVIFEILPYFVEKPEKKVYRKYSKGEIIKLLSKKLNVFDGASERAKDFLNIPGLKEALKKLEDIIDRSPCLFPRGLVTKAQFETHFFKSLEHEILKSEKKRIEKLIEKRTRFMETDAATVSLLLTVVEKGALEIDGFGFYSTNLEGEFIIYKRTGRYALQDYYGRTYLFPDCRVAVSTNGILDPFVIETYKHPFLQKYTPGQKICMRNVSVPATFSAQNAIFAIQEGINALLYGYDYRKRNGYHSLDGMPMPGNSMSFKDYMVPKTHPDIKSGKVQITNEFR